MQAEAYNFIKINNPPWVLFTFFKLYKWYQIAQRTTYVLKLLENVVISMLRTFWFNLTNTPRVFHVEST